MKRKLLTIMALLVSALAQGQVFQQINIVLDSEVPKDKNCVYEASTSIKLLPGLRCDPAFGKSVMFTIDRFGVFPPNEGLYGGPSAGQKGVVGALPGELNISDMGAAVYSVPIMMPQGLGEITPDLAITYNSQAGNGLMGWGWSLSGLSAITRAPKTVYHDGVHGSVNFVDDRFLMDGQRLMVCSGSYGANGSVYKTEIDEMSKIVAYSNGYNGPGRFTVYKKDGKIWEYGATADSRIEPQNQNNVVLKWLVNRIYDRDGNSMVFSYTENQSTGEYYINRIDYTLNENAGIQTMYRVIFNYVNRDDEESGYVYANLVQTKKILTGITVKNMMTGAVLYDYSFEYLNPGNYSDDYKFMYYRLSAINLVADGMRLNPTIISWNRKQKHYPDKFQSYSLTKTTFNKVPFIGDFNGDGYSDVITVPYKTGNTYQSNVLAEVHLNNGNGTFDDSPYYTFSFDRTLEWLYIADFDGDGLDDVIPYFYNNDENATWRGKIKVFLNNGGLFTYIGEKSNYYYGFTLYPGDFCNENRVSFFMDFNTDENYGINTPNIIYYRNGSIVMQSLGSAANEYDPDRIVAADINGDGRSEVLYFMSNKMSVAKITKQNNSYVFNTMYTTEDFDSDDYLFVGDFNGDGYLDFLKYDNVTYWKIVFSDGHRMTGPVACYDNNLLRGVTLAPQDRYACSLQNLSTPSITIRTADFDGDGKTDVAVFKNTGGNYYMEVGLNMRQSAGNTYGFSDIRRFYLNINFAHQYIHVGNFLGQENASILSTVRSNPSNNEYPKIVALNTQTAKYSVERITDGLGNVRGFSYEYLMPYKENAFYDYEYQWLNNDLRTVPIPVMALRTDTVFTTNGHPCVTEYSYRNALYHNKGNGLLGFERNESKVLINNSLHETDVVSRNMELLTDNYITLPEAHFKYNYADQPVLEEHYSYNLYSCALNDKVSMPLLTVRKTLSYDFDRANTVLKTNIANYEYQSDRSGFSYSDIVHLHKATEGSDSAYTGDEANACEYRSTTEYEYSDNVGQWVVARPASVRKSANYGDGDAVGSCDLYQYSGNNPFHVTHQTSLPNVNMNHTDPLKIETEYTYDAVGHVIAQALSSPSARAQKITRLDYGKEYNYRFPTTTTNENGWEIHNAFNSDYGMLSTSVDYNQFATICNSDPFDITVEKSLPDGLRSVKTKRWSSGNEHAPQGAVYYCWEKATGKAETMSFFSKDGKNLRDVTVGLNGEAVYVDYAYDDYGNVVTKSMPYVVGGDVINNYYYYDKNNRLLQETMPYGLVKYYSYNQLQTTMSSVSPEGVEQDVTVTVNSEGWRMQVVDNGGNSINYSYYSDGKLRSAMIGDNAATKVEYEYDNRRNMTKMKDPACGEVLYAYDAYGQLIWTKTPRNCELSYEYDQMGNILSRMESGSNGENQIVTRWIYDDAKGKIGALARIVYGDKHIVAFNYDGLLRVSSVMETIEGRNYTAFYTYDGAGREEFLTYPSGITVQKQYSNSGYHRSVIDPADGAVLWRSNEADAMGYITDYQLGNGLATQRSYDKESNFLKGIFTTKDGQVYQDLTYDFDAFGNLRNRADHIGPAKSESFEYDEFNRLVDIRLNNRQTGSMAYDIYGNIRSKTIDNQDVYYDAEYNGNCPYAVSKVKTDKTDLNGINQNIEYTVFDKMSRVVSGGNTLSIDYGYDYGRLHSVEVVGGMRKEKVYVKDCEFVNEGGKSRVYTYLKGPLGVFAVFTSEGKGDNVISYIHKDHQDSWCLITDAVGNIQQKMSYDAWGNPRSSSTWTGNYNGGLMFDRGFTGHEHYVAFGIINMNGRAYDPMQSMMMSPDTQIQSPDFSQNYNRYIYCFNNPLSYTDPSGESVEWLFFGLLSGTVNVILNWDSIDGWGEGLLAFGSGFVQGCLIKGFSGYSWGVQVMTSMAGNTLTDCTNKLIQENSEGNSIDWSILLSRKYKNDFWYSIGSNMATSVLSAYIIHPTKESAGMSLSSLVGKSKAGKNAVETTAGKLMGNIFSGRKLFAGIDMSFNNVSRIMPYLKNVYDYATDGIEFEGKSKTLGKVFDKILSFDLHTFFTKMGSDLDYCYSQLRSLFLKSEN